MICEIQATTATVINCFCKSSLAGDLYRHPTPVMVSQLLYSFEIGFSVDKQHAAVGSFCDKAERMAQDMAKSLPDALASR